MSAAAVQAVVIAFALLWAAAFAARRLMPATTRRAQARLAGAFDRPAAPAWLRRLARRAQPVGTSGARCGDGCPTCGGCGGTAPAGEARPLTFHPRPKR